MMHGPRPSLNGSSDNSREYREVFVSRIHELLRLGYERMTPASHANAEETAITGDFVASINSVLDERREEWMLAYSVHDDPAENDGRRKGKHRKRLDLRFDSAFSSPRSRFRFEAKRLGKGHSVKKYLGSEGLDCFLRGDYARNESHAGMLGYIQSGNIDDWGSEIDSELKRDPKTYQVDSSFKYAKMPIRECNGVSCHRSRHQRKAIGRDILIDHVLLAFC